MRAAASSIASGSPSSRRQISATASRSDTVRSRRCSRARARSTNSCTASVAVIASGLASGPGTSSGSSRCRTSPAMPSGSRLVARMRKPGSRCTSASASSATCVTTCSQLSSTTTICRPSSHSSIASTYGRPRVRRSPRHDATSTTTSDGSCTELRSATRAPSGYVLAVRAATSSASRVLPTPAGPTIVTSAEPSSASTMRGRSDSRPTNDERPTGTRPSPPLMRVVTAPLQPPRLHYDPTEGRERKQDRGRS
jgi:hypothetical protein